ncbi:hypothetical protein FACS1894208_08180 [Clostridia bacterium]|nr:hypothetical protein FACS1894208_08180 [Clostridia bacterium]
MLHAICDVCGKDCDRVALFVTVTPFQNFARHERDTTPFGTTSETKSSIVCQDCGEKLPFSNPHAPRLVEPLHYERLMVLAHNKGYSE